MAYTTEIQIRTFDKTLTTRILQSTRVDIIMKRKNDSELENCKERIKKMLKIKSKYDTYNCLQGVDLDVTSLKTIYFCPHTIRLQRTIEVIV